MTPHIDPGTGCWYQHCNTYLLRDGSEVTKCINGDVDHNYACFVFFGRTFAEVNRNCECIDKKQNHSRRFSNNPFKFDTYAKDQ